MVPRRRILGEFLPPAFPASRVQHISDLHSKFAPIVSYRIVSALWAEASCLYAHIYTMSQKKGATLTMATTLSILGGFAKFFHYCKEQ